MDIFRCNVFEVDLKDAGTVVHIELHAGRCHQIVQRQLRMGFQLRIIAGGTNKGVAGSFPQSARIHLLYPFHDLKKSSLAGNTIGLKGGSASEADGLFRAGEIRHNEIGGEGIEAPFNAFNRSVKGL